MHARIDLNMGSARVNGGAPPPPENAISVFSEMEPDNDAYVENQYYTLGTKFKFNVPGKVYGIRFFLDENDGNSRTVVLYEAGVFLSLFFTAAPVTNNKGWVEVVFHEPITIDTSKYYLICVDKSESAKYYATNFFFDTEYASPGNEVVAVANSESNNGMFRVGSLGLPTDTYNSSFYWTDVIFVPDE